MALLTNLASVLALPLFSSALFLNLNQLGKDFEKKYNLGFLTDYFKFPIYVNPHPNCALEDEGCIMDTNCCGGLECKMVVDKKGLKNTCQARVGDPEQDAETMSREEDNQDWQTLQEPEDDNSLLAEIYKTRLEELNQEEKRLINDQYYLIKELQKPLSLDEIRELTQIKEVEDYKRQGELKDLRQWMNSKKAKEEQERANENKLKDLAVERVAKVLREEEQQKLQMFKEIQEQMKRKKSWF
ncbi:uncharacterized protein LOC129004307 [Macrosteles quadrilineatus]|uniref:uncharacterized protein LOC129004307 n=1 Tax=Macrosteles quadrilineatus TaxID=74068 RepID=UPI0023E0EC7D|nr:uncharacterized protein LOC129004307 [Macrosteles quadrilineatus]